MLVPNRHQATDDFRYGFNGKEKDDEIKGEGNSINYEKRFHDSRVGRFLSLDPLMKQFPWYTPYQFAGNKPIAAIDLDGLEERIVIMSTVQGGGVRREVISFNTLQRKVEMVGVKNSARYSSITQQEFLNYKKAYWDAFSNSPELFNSGFESYTIGMNKKEYQNSGFTGLFKGELTISSGATTSLSYSSTYFKKPKPKTLEIINDAGDEKKNPEMAKGIDTAKNYVNGVSLVVTGPELLAGKAETLDYIGAIYDVDQLTGILDPIKKNYPKIGEAIDIAEIFVDIASLKSSYTNIKNFNLVECNINASSMFPSTMTGAADTIGDVHGVYSDDLNGE